MAAKSGKPVFHAVLTLAICSMAFSSVLQSEATSRATLTPNGGIVGGWRPLCPACVCCRAPPPGSCCQCCAAPVESQSISDFVVDAGKSGP